MGVVMLLYTRNLVGMMALMAGIRDSHSETGIDGKGADINVI